MNYRWIIALFMGMGLKEVSADPCGMVPPIAVSNADNAILRTGAQRTYVFFRDGIETIALRPGFSGTVEDFGMLIPFPSPPALRKIEDDTFKHIEGAIDPPKVNVHIYDPSKWKDRRGGQLDQNTPTMAVEKKSSLRYDEVRVLNEEAVGMYQVAVLEAGSAAALQKWMKKNGYRYPTGMDDVANEYVAERWCFVAIKATVGQAPGVKAKPGMKKVNPKRPKGSKFDGHVQGMAFRFKSKKAVIPMRLSVFNGKNPRNVVYALTNQAVRLDKVHTNSVVRQLKGKKLHHNLTKKLDVIYHNGKASDISEADKSRVEKMRDPTPYNRIARDLFASDMLAVRKQKLSLPFEEMEKELLRVSESFGLRGKAIDTLHNTELRKARSVAVDGALGDLYEMHISVIDGIYPEALLAKENLKLVSYKMPVDKNNRRTDVIRPPDLSTTARKQQ